MTKLIALDVAILPPADVAARAVALNATLPSDPASGLRLDEDHLPHVTLTQQFVREEELALALDQVDDVLRAAAPLRLTATGGVKEGPNVSIAIERTPALDALHEGLMEALRGVERHEGTAAAFVDHDARLADVLWVTGYRLKSSFGAFAPHITLGHGDEAPAIEPFTFEATTIAACHLGRYCTCRRVLRSWTLR